MRRYGFVGKTITLKVKYSDFEMVTRSATLDTPTDDATRVYATCGELLGKTKAGARPVRLLGIYLSRLTAGPPAGQMSLLEDEKGRERRQQLHHAQALAGEQGLLLDKLAL